jgi:hypothetical protein
MKQQSASADEAAAIAAAVERFVGETTMAAPEAAEASPWQRAALLEGVSAKRTIEDLEGEFR